MKKNGYKISSWKLLETTDCVPVKMKISASLQHWFEIHEHSHVRHELFAVIKGRCLIQVGRCITQIKAGEILLLESMITHTQGHLPDEKSVFWWCMMDSGQLNMLLWKNNRINSFMSLEIGKFSEILEYMINGIKKTRRKKQAKQTLQELFAVFIDYFFQYSCISASPSDNHSNQEEAIRNVLTYLDAMPTFNCSLVSAAAMANYSPVHFQRIFRKYTHESFRDYMQKKRIERYNVLCEKGNVAKKEIASILGFSSTAALNHWEISLKKKKQK